MTRPGIEPWSLANTLPTRLMRVIVYDALDKRGKNILPHYLFGDKIIQKCIKIDATH